MGSSHRDFGLILALLSIASFLPATVGAGLVLVADAANHRVQKFASTGAYIAQWGLQGSGNGEFNAPQAVATNAVNNVYVADSNNRRIQKFTNAGTYITQWGSQGS